MPGRGRRLNFNRLVNIMARLRGEPGCPWDKEQTLEKLKPYLLEECYEVLDAIDHGASPKLKEELGDLLFQIVFMARICEEENWFDISGVIETISKKMIRRHPHVFGQVKVDSSAQVLKNWARIKGEEKAETNQPFLSDIPKGLPSLLRARRVTEKASQVGFDWEAREDVYLKVKEELGEFEQALKSNDAKHLQEELGDLLFSLVNLARFIEVDPEDALRRTVDKFISRFNYIERRLKESGKNLHEVGTPELEELWEESKGVNLSTESVER